MPGQRLAKLTRPRLHGALPRERLFLLLDKMRENAAVWINGPPGSGKTTLAASYLEAAEAPALWYSFDSADSDPATFFLYFARAVADQSRKRRHPLPLFTQEFIVDLEGFSRRFFREAFTRLPAGSLVVLDNYHEISAESTLHGMLNAAIAEVPRGSSLVVISRAEPPGIFSRAMVSGSMAFLGWDHLRLDPGETAALAASRQMLDREQVAAVHARSQGWAAGVRLMLEVDKSSRGIAALDHSLDLEKIFDYFAAEIFQSIPESSQNILLQTAFLSRFTVAMAATVSKDMQAGKYIDQIYRRRLFIDRRVAKSVAYQYHDLFRAFLQNQVINQFPATRVTDLIERSASVLLDEGLIEDAYALFVQAKNWAAAERLFLDNARILILQGRWRTLEEWGDSLPPTRLDRDPWLRYWLGYSKSLVNPGEGYSSLTAAYRSFRHRADGHGALLSCATIIETLHFLLEHWESMGTWLKRLRENIDTCNASLPTEDELRVHCALFWAFENGRDLDSSAIQSSVARVAQLLPQCADLNLKVSVGNILHYHSVRAMDVDISRIAAECIRPFLKSPDLSADRLALYYLAEGMALTEASRFVEALDCYDRADQIIEASGLAGRDRIAGVWRAMCQFAMGDIDSGVQTLDVVERTQPTKFAIIEQVYNSAKSWSAMSQGQIDVALKYNEAGIRLMDEAGIVAVLGFILPNQAYMQIANAQLDLANASLARIRSQPWFSSFGHFNGAVTLLEAWKALRASDEATCQAALRDCLVLSRDVRERFRMRWYSRALAELLPVALELGIESETASTLAREYGLVPDATVSDSWPWPVKIYTLGRFEITIGENPLTFGRKAPKRTLALLKALIAFGGIEVPEQRLADVLWPDLDGDAALGSLSAALHRLRRLLGTNDVIRQSGGMLSLNRQCCYVDALAFEARIDDSSGRSPIPLYEGPFLHADGDASWAVSMRERLRGKFIRAVILAGHNLEQAGAHEEAIRLYVRGIEADELIESFHQGLMRCHGKLGRSAEAASAYRRLSQALSIMLGTQPSRESRDLFEQLRHHQFPGN